MSGDIVVSAGGILLGGMMAVRRLATGKRIQAIICLMCCGVLVGLIALHA